jgi:hypothetical protein
LTDNCFKFRKEVAIDNEHRIRKFGYDGGLLRIWLNDGQMQISPDDSAFLALYGQICSNANLPGDGEFRQIYENSVHENLGDLTVVANKNVTFCKNSWLDENVLTKIISNRATLAIGELPLGEHGTYHPEDRFSLLMSNHDFGAEYFQNTEIIGLIEIAIKEYLRIND